MLSGGFKNIVEAKCYHGILVLAQLQDWTHDERGEMRINLSSLHKLTKHACERWESYLKVLQRIKDTITLDWGILSNSVGGFNRVGNINILSEVRAEMDLVGNFSEIAFRIPAVLLEDVIKPKWFGQVNPEILFSIKSNYAFNAYLHASLTIIEKDSRKHVFWSPSLPIDDWKLILGADETMPNSRFRANVLNRVESAIKRTTKNTDEPIDIKFIATAKKNHYQMRVSRLKLEKLKSDRAIQQKKYDEEILRRRIKEKKQIESDLKEASEWVESHPRKDEIIKKYRERFGDEAFTSFGLDVIGEGIESD